MICLPRARRLSTTLTAVVAVAAATGLAIAVPSAAASTRPRPTTRPVTITLMTHDSFAVSKSVLRSFTRGTGITVKLLPSGDAGQALNKAILSKGHPLADAFFGVDNTLLSRAVQAGIFEHYRSPRLATVRPELRGGTASVLTPVDFGDVCVNYDRKFFASKHLAPPATLADLARPRYRGLLVVENPATSSPGLAFLLATVAKYGTRGWEGYWKQLFANDVEAVDGWEQAYNTEFSGSAGKGPRPLVVSYASSPPAEVYFAKPRPASAPTGVVTASCFRQVEYAGILHGTKHRAAAEALVDFLLSRQFQEDVPLQMFVYPARGDAALPDVFVKFSSIAKQPLRLDPATIARNRDRWVEQWTARYRG
ncbi:MAG: thiamine ABC transporter substrate-binding protein [Acidimicrobiia bacterium]